MNTTKELLFKDYFGDNKNAYDEMFTSDMQIKPSWKTLHKHLHELGFDELSTRQKDIDWILSENGVTYNVYNDPKGLNRPWNLNIVPLVIQEDEWKTIEKGLKQRVHLLDLVLKDIYGKRELIKNGIIPHEVVYGHRGFLRQCDQIKYLTKKQLSVYACDLSRGPDGRIWVVNDRAQAPSGMGYSLENRATAGRVLSDIYRNIHVRKLNSFFNDFNQLLIKASPKQVELPTIIILTPGPHNETYFEHAYLSSFLGYPLVRGNDLVVRDGFLWMKSLKGLKRVDVVLRRVDDAFMDPLELREDSHLGVAGLLDVVRRQNVTIINPIGSGIIENSGLIPFMPAIAEYFLNEDLILPQIATWWCGQEKERNHVLDEISKYVIKRIDRSKRESIYFGAFLNEDEKKDLKVKIEKEPYLYVAQERINFSTIPNFSDGLLEPRNMVFRGFAIAKDDDYEVMPGGLVRVSPERGNHRVSNQRGGTSKDFCIVGEAPQNETKKPDKERNYRYASGLKDLPSNTAENLYWAGRYVGRTLVVSRFLRMTLKQVVKNTTEDSTIQNDKLSILLKTLTQLTGTFPGFVGKKEDVEVTIDIREELESILFDKNRMGSLAQTMSMFTNSYYAIRNLWSSDMWRVFKIIQKTLNFSTEKNIKKLSYNAIIKFLDELITQIIAFMGLIEESILVNQGLLLYFIGLNLEQGLLTISKSRAMLTVNPDDHVGYEVLESLLNSHESLNIYRYSYRSYITIENVLELLLLDPKYTRSLTYTVSRIQKDINKLPFSEDSNNLQTCEKFIFEAYSKLRLADVENLAKLDTENDVFRKNLKELLSSLSDLLFNTSQAITDTYFNHTFKQNQLTSQSFPH